MPMSSTLKSYLNEQGIRYVHRTHPRVFTAQEVAAIEHIPGIELAKAVVLSADNEMVMAVLPASYVVNLETFKQYLGVSKMQLAAESELREIFPTCELGAVPPLGNLFGLRVFCDSSLERDREIEFNAGTHTDTIRMDFADFVRLARPKMLQFADKHRGRMLLRSA